MFDHLTLDWDIRLPPQASQHPMYRYCCHCKGLVGYREYVSHVPECLQAHIDSLWAENRVARQDDWYPDPRLIRIPKKKYRRPQIELLEQEPCPKCTSVMDTVASVEEGLVYYCDTCAKTYRCTDVTRSLANEVDAVFKALSQSIP
jgi:predicted RNA-binding Zn-ribbon protein involved in translation (DUF1610 family)